MIPMVPSVSTIHPQSLMEAFLQITNLKHPKEMLKPINLSKRGTKVLKSPLR